MPEDKSASAIVPGKLTTVGVLVGELNDKVKPKLPDKVRNKYIIMRDSMLKYLIANEQEVIDQLSK